MLRPRSDNTTKGINSRKRGENDEPVVGPHVGKQQENTHHSNDSHGGLLKDKNLNQRSVQSHASSKPGEKDRLSLNSPSQKVSKFKVFSDKENDTAVSPKKSVTPVKRPSSSLDVLYPHSKRTDSFSGIEHGHTKEEELPYIPDIDLDFSEFDDRIDIGVYEAVSPKAMLEPIEESESPLEEADSPVKASEPVGVIDIPDEVEYGPPQEEELSYEPAVDVDLSRFSELPDISAYEYVETSWEAPAHADDDVVHHNDQISDKFNRWTDLDESPFFDTEQEIDYDDSIPFANYIFDVDAYLCQSC